MEEGCGGLFRGVWELLKGKWDSGDIFHFM